MVQGLDNEISITLFEGLEKQVEVKYSESLTENSADRLVDNYFNLSQKYDSILRGLESEFGLKAKYFKSIRDVNKPVTIMFGTEIYVNDNFGNPDNPKMTIDITLKPVQGSGRQEYKTLAESVHTFLMQYNPNI